MVTKKELDSLEQINASFINSLREVIVPFIKKLEFIHKNKIELNEDELQKLKKSTDLIKIYSSKEAAYSKFMNGRMEQKILADIRSELAIVMRIIQDSNSEKLDFFYSHCEELQATLHELANDIVAGKKVVA